MPQQKATKLAENLCATIHPNDPNLQKKCEKEMRPKMKEVVKEATQLRKLLPKIAKQFKKAKLPKLKLK